MGLRHCGFKSLKAEIGRWSLNIPIGRGTVLQTFLQAWVITILLEVA
ncbi:hypothetical protein LINPERHAP1_LOCUS26563 [Linum perenne]